MARTGAMRGAALHPALCAYLVAVLLPVQVQAGPVLLTSVRAVLLLLLAPLVWGLLRGRFGPPIWTDALLAAHVLWIPVAFARTTPDFAASQAGSVGLELIGGYLVGRAFVRDARAFRAVIAALAGALALLLPAAIHEAATGKPILLEALRALPGIGTPGVVTIERRLGLERVQSVFAHPIHFGLFASSLLSLVVLGLRGAGAWRWPLAAAAALATFLSLSSGAILAAAIQCGLLAWAACIRWRWRWALLLSLCAAAYVAIDLASDRTPIRVFMSYATFSPHNAFWRAQIFDWGLDNVTGNAARGIESAWLFGIGMGDWIRPHYMNSGSMDNFWLVLAVRYGVPGAALLAAGYGLLVWQVARAPVPPEVRDMRIAWAIAFTGLTFTLATVHIWTSIHSYVFFLLGAGAWMARPGPAPHPPRRRVYARALPPTLRSRTVPQHAARAPNAAVS